MQYTPTNHDFQLFNAVSAISEADAWAVGAYSDFDYSPYLYPLMEHWDGTAWMEIDGPLLPKGGDLYGVSALSARDVWAVGDQGEVPDRPLVEHWDGSAWTIVPSPSPGQRYTGSGFEAVSARSRNDVWAVGDRSTRLGTFPTLIEHWDGERWTVAKSPNVPGQFQDLLYGVAAITATDVWAAGFTGWPYGLLEHWDGTAWTVVDHPHPSYSENFYAISASSSSDVWAVGTYPDDFGRMLNLSEHWDGSEWTVVDFPPGGQIGSLYGVSALPSGAAWAVGTGATGPIGDHLTGATWRQIPGETPGDLSNQFFGVSALSDSSVWAVGDWIDNDGPMHTLVEYLC